MQQADVGLVQLVILDGQSVDVVLTSLAILSQPLEVDFVDPLEELYDVGGHCGVAAAYGAYVAAGLLVKGLRRRAPDLPLAVVKREAIVAQRTAVLGGPLRDAGAPELPAVV